MRKSIKIEKFKHYNKKVNKLNKNESFTIIQLIWSIAQVQQTIMYQLHLNQNPTTGKEEGHPHLNLGAKIQVKVISFIILQ